jgi:hypothetical protein
MSDKPEAEQAFTDEDEAEDLCISCGHRLYEFVGGLKGTLATDTYLELTHRVDAYVNASKRLARAKERSALRLLNPERQDP